MNATQLHGPLLEHMLRGTVHAHTDFHSFQTKLLSNEPSAVVTGLSTSGLMHYGNLRPLRIVRTIRDAGARAYISVANTEAMLTRDNSTWTESITAQLSRMGFSEDEFYVHGEREDVRSLEALFAETLREDDFSNSYGHQRTPTFQQAACHMLADMFFPQTEGYGNMAVVIGIDELSHTRLATLAARRAGFQLPAFVLTETVRGLTGAKMSKSAEEQNILLCDTPEQVKMKLSTATTRTLGEPERCVAYQVAQAEIPLGELERLSNGCQSNPECGSCINTIADYLRP